MREKIFVPFALAISMILWVLTIATTHITTIPIGTIGGLALSLPLFYWFGLVLLIVSIVCLINNKELVERKTFFILPLLLLLAYFLWIPYFVEDLPRILSTFVHMGEAKQIITDLAITPDSVFYHHWPGMLLVTAELLLLSGLQDVVLLKILPILFSLLYLIPLYLIFSLFFKEKIYPFLGLVLFILGNWIGQTHWSIQNPIFFVYLVMVYFILRVILEKEELTPELSLALLAMLFVLVSSHAITPYVLFFNLLFLGVMVKNKPLIYSSLFIAAVYLFWQFTFAGYPLVKFVPLLIKKMLSITDIFLFNEGLGRIALTSIYNISRVFLKGLMLFSFAALTGYALWKLWKTHTTDVRKKIKFYGVWLASVLFFGLTLRFGSEIIERTILFALVPCILLILFAYQQKMVSTGIVLYIIFASVLFVPVFYFNESFETVTATQVDSRVYVKTYFDPEKYTVMDQRLLLWLYDMNYDIERILSSTDFTLRDLPEVDVYIVDEQSKAMIDSYYEGGSTAYETIEDGENNDYNKVYADTEQGAVYTKNDE